MYTIFVNKRKLVLTSSLSHKDKLNKHCYSIKRVDIYRVINKLLKGKIDVVYLYHPDKDKLLKLFKEKIKTVKAGGGLVYNQHQELLFIYRNNKWDLPKGKMEKQEKIRDTAVREVQEETGLEELECQDFIIKTYHIFKKSGYYRLKETHWYHMNSNDNQNLVPQEKEGITEVAWKPVAEIPKLLTQSYPNIRLVLEEKMDYRF